ncbi:alpha/beta hydrolase [Chitinophaga agrisoli]|uniref:Alpha/beta hydrolase n=1 Tax=Chitinophaga agrisoli TaxID=2607653 RepID=A0A5B2VVZ6_9BACT|nr:dienelactone hydrolase family protein [Chitinophaga agrisoli]KAA2243285.1 alpha/beta hydrolase [Chitinophaga agrisoli]
MKRFFHDTVRIPVGRASLEAELTLPQGSNAIVIFAHASSRSRFCKRYKKVAYQLQQEGYSTLLLDLLTHEEDIAYYYTRVDIKLLTDRMMAVTEWLESNPRTAQLSMGYFGAGTGAAAALKAASQRPQVQAIVCRGGSPDLVTDVLPEIEAPTLLIAGSMDHHVLKHNRSAFEHLQCPKQLLEIAGAGQMFVEGQAMDVVMEATTDWFHQYLAVAPTV